jgi:nitroreductase/acyl-coenzyme A thioesterase PaaI-like protein
MPGYGCFGCAPPERNHQGLGMTFRREGDKLVSDWTPRPHFQGFDGILHGGIQGTLIDEIASWVVFTICGTAGVTERLELEYLKSAALKNGPFRLEAALEKQDRRSAVIGVELKDVKGRLCTRGSASYRLFSKGMARDRLDYPGPEAFSGRGGHVPPGSDPMLAKFRARRSVRRFSGKPVDLDTVRSCIEIAGTAPSGANCQPWTFALVSSPGIKHRIRKAAEKVETRFYESAGTKAWRDDLADLRTGAEKRFLEEAPCLIVLFLQRYGRDHEGRKINHYYPAESLGLATGFLMAALHLKGLATLPYTPSPMTFLSESLERPENERPYLVMPVGYPAADWNPPELERKSLESILVEY